MIQIFCRGISNAKFKGLIKARYGNLKRTRKYTNRKPSTKNTTRNRITWRFKIRKNTKKRVDFEIFSSPDFFRTYRLDFSKLCRNVKHKKDLECQEEYHFGIAPELHLYISLKDFGPLPEEYYPLYCIFSPLFPFDHILRNILSHLSCQSLISTVSTVSKYLRSEIKKMNFQNELLTLESGSIQTILQISDSFHSTNLRRFCVHKLIQKHHYDDFLFPKKRELPFISNSLILNNITALQIDSIELFMKHSIKSKKKRDKETVKVLKTVFRKFKNLAFFCISIPHLYRPPEPYYSRPDAKKNLFDVHNENVKSIIEPLQRSKNQSIERLFSSKRKKLLQKKNQKQNGFSFHGKVGNTILFVINGVFISVEVEREEKKICVFNETLGVAINTNFQISIKDSDRKRNGYCMNCQFTKDLTLYTDEYRYFTFDDDEHEDVEMIWRFGGRFFGDFKLKLFGEMKMNQAEILRQQEQQGVRGVKYEDYLMRIEINRKKRLEFHIKLNDEGCYFEENILFLGLEWCLCLQNWEGSTYISFTPKVVKRFRQNLPFFYSGEFLFCLDGKKWFKCMRNTRISKCRGFSVGEVLEGRVELDVIATINEVWRNEYSDEEKDSLDVMVLEKRDHVKNQFVGRNEEKDFEVSNFYDYSSFSVEMLRVGWIFVFHRRKESIYLGLKRGFVGGIVMPVMMEIHLLGTTWKVESGLWSFSSPKGLIFENLPKKEFLELVKGSEKFKIRLRLKIGENIITKKEYDGKCAFLGLRTEIKYGNKMFSEELHFRIPEMKRGFKLPFFVQIVKFAGICYNVMFAPSENGKVCLFLTHSVPFASTTIVGKWFLFELLEIREESGMKVGFDKVLGLKRRKEVLVNTMEQVICFREICGFDEKFVLWKFRISMLIQMKERKKKKKRN